MRWLAVWILFIIPALGIAQDSIVQWKAKTLKTGDNTYTLTADIIIPSAWHIYADAVADIGIDNINIEWDNENIVKDGAPAISKTPVQINDPVFENKKLKVYTEGTLTLSQKIKVKGTVPASLKISLKGFASNNTEFTPVELTTHVALEGGVVDEAVGKIKLSSIDTKKPVLPCGDENEAGQGLFTVFLLGLGGGLIALLTPCVFPMIPVTVSFFTNKASTRQKAIKNGALYGFFIFLIYVIASAPFHVIDNVQPEIFNNISTNAWLNVFFFVVFIVFAISFFGFFEITLPSGITNKVDAKSGLGSVSGIFFMALTLVIVSFSCTGIILGTLLVGTAGDGAWSLTVGMAGFGTALALPFALFAIFPSWLKSLPKSGGWLDTVKKILAFVEVALAFKFLSNADLVEHWGLLKREVFIGLWIIVSIALGLYLFGWIKLPHDYKGQKISAGRKVLGVLSFLFALYLLPGLTATPYANLKLLSGMPPPLNYSIYKRTEGVEPAVINDFDKAVQLAKAQNKPILIDFTGWACVNCRKMEEQVWTKPEIAELLNEKFILVSLYVDDRSKLPTASRFLYKTSAGAEKDIVTIGDKWATFQAENFGKSAQPLYAVLNAEGKLMTYPVGYTDNANKYKEWLNCGIKAYTSGK
ncbi:MAG: thioredoxin family protein [Agriterribacter sp.]